jgi:hypothetical protein
MRLRGRYHLIHRGKNSYHEEAGKNLVMDAGKDQLAVLFHTSPGAARPDYMALGDDASPVDVTHTDLQGNEHDRVGSTTDTDSGNEITLEFDFTATGAWSLREAGIFNNAAAGPASGTMFARFLTTEVTMAVGDTLNIFWTLEFGG